VWYVFSTCTNQAQRTMGKFLDAAEIVLRRGGEPMIVSKLTEQALSDRLLDGCNGDTPIQTMKAKLSVDIKVNGARSRFKRIGPGLFALRDSTGDEYVARPFQKQLRASENVLVLHARRQLPSSHRMVGRSSRALPRLQGRLQGRITPSTPSKEERSGTINRYTSRARGLTSRFVSGSLGARTA